MNISEMTPHEKSAALSKLCNITFVSQGGHDGQFIGNAVNFNGQWLPGLYSHNLYDPSEMALLAKVIEWLIDIRNWPYKDGEGDCYQNHFSESVGAFWPHNIHGWMLHAADQGLKWAIEAGMVSDG